MIGDHFYTTSAAERDNATTMFGYVNEGVACNIFSQPRPLQLGDHAYTVSQAFRDFWVTYYGYKEEGIACYVLPQQTRDTIPLFRSFSWAAFANFYTTSSAEVNSASALGYSYQGIEGYVFQKENHRGLEPLFRLRNTQTGYHFYTTDPKERDNAINLLYYVSEGIQSYVPSSSAGIEGRKPSPLYRLVRVTDPFASVPLYRLYGNGFHFYTTSLPEAQAAAANLGYTMEGVTGYVQTASYIPGATPLYRLLSRDTGGHFYTISAPERDNAVANLHYNDEGIAAYVYPPNVQPYIGAVTPLYRLNQTTSPAPPSSQQPPQLTCDGKPVTAATQNFVFMAQDNLTKAMFSNVWIVKANSLADAQACAQNQVNSLFAGATAVPAGSVKTFYFAGYSDNYCSTYQILNTSSSNAETCLLATVCANCSFQDITAFVTDSNGVLDGPTYNNWCTDHPPS